MVPKHWSELSSSSVDFRPVATGGAPARSKWNAKWSVLLSGGAR